MRTTPVLYKDTQGDTTVLFNVIYGNDLSSANLMGFDPDNGNVAAVPTGATILTALSKAAPNGVVYCYGGVAVNASGGRPQAFGIRVDDLPQAERDFIIESQLMQDPQDPGGSGGSTITTPDGNVIPPSKARYQTHLTVVDDQKSPRPNETVKIWADVDGTVITVNGTQYTVGPADSAYASVKTGVDGSLVIVSDATNINTSALRVWATFMNPYERIVVYPDHEWHGRASSSSDNPNADPTKSPDPTKPNLSTTHNYQGTQLFTNDEKSQGTPGNVAKAVGQMNSGLKPGGNQPAAVAGALKTLHGSNPTAPYVAYTTLGGMHYGPNNARAKRTATIAAPFGFMLNKPQGGQHTYASMSHSDARSAIDALEGTPWVNPNPTSAAGGAGATNGASATFVIRRRDDFFTDFWNWLVGAINTVVQAIENVIVIVAEDIMVGINFIVNGVKQVFKAIIQVVEDVVNAIGSFFMQLIKLIEDVIEALSVLFHFGEIMWTHRWLAGQIQAQKEALKTVMTQTCKPALDQFFTDGETVISDYIDQIKKSLNPGSSIRDLHSMGSTPHTAMSAAPGSAGNAASGNSQAVQGGWGIQSMKSGLGNGVGGASSAAKSARPVPQLAGNDPVTDFVNSFVQSLSSDPSLSAAFTDVKNDFNRLVTPDSAQQFFVTLLDTLLDIVKTMLVGALAIGKAIFDGLIAIISDVIDLIWNALTTNWDIPVISWLYKLLFNEDLNLLNLVTLVVAIPVTIIYRVVAGEYPQDSNNKAASQALANQGGAGPQKIQDGILADWQQKIMGTTVAILSLVYGIVNAFLDILYPNIRDGFSFGFDFVMKVATYISVGLGLIIQVLSYPLWTNNQSSLSWQDWAVYGWNVGIAVWAIFGTPAVDLNEAQATVLGAAMGFVSVLLIGAAIWAFVADKKTDVNTDLGFAANIIGAIPIIVNPLKYLEGWAGRLGGTVDAIVDVVAGAALCALIMATTWHQESALPRSPRRLYFPFVAANPTTMHVHPRTLMLAGATP